MDQGGFVYIVRLDQIFKGVAGIPQLGVEQTHQQVGIQDQCFGEVHMQIKL